MQLGKFAFSYNSGGITRTACCAWRSGNVGAGTDEKPGDPFGGAAPGLRLSGHAGQMPNPGSFACKVGYDPFEDAAGKGCQSLVP